MKNVVRILLFASISFIVLLGNSFEFNLNNDKERFSELSLFYKVTTTDSNTSFAIHNYDKNKNYFSIKNFRLSIPSSIKGNFAQKLKQYQCKIKTYDHIYFFKKLRKKLDIDCFSKDNNNIISLIFFENIGLVLLEENMISSGKIIQKLKVVLHKIQTKDGSISGSMLYEPDSIIIKGKRGKVTGDIYKPANPKATLR